jgi:thiol-disulfide isomerase/thioredoxin
MTIRQQWAVVLAVVGLLGVGLWVATRVLGDELFPVTIGSEAPPFSGTLVGAGAPVTKSLDDYRDSVVLLNVWATWCLPCRTEMPSIQALHERYAPHGLKVVAVSIDDPGSEAAIRDFAAEYGLTFEILHDPSGAIRRDYQTTGVPETFVIGPDRVIRRKQIGHTDWNSPANRALVARLLGVPGDTAVAPPPAAGGDAPPRTPLPAPAGSGAPGAR